MKQNHLLDTLMIAIDSALSDLHTATIAKVTRVNATTVACQPVTSRIVNGVKIDLPEFADVPVLFMQGGGSYTAYPIKSGDYALLIITERAFDRWYAGQDNEPPIEFRMHDYSDGIAIVGVNPLAAAINIPSLVERKGNTHQIGDMKIDGAINHTGATHHIGAVQIDGDTHQNGVLTVTDIMIGGVSMAAHVHGGVASGLGTTGTPQ